MKIAVIILLIMGMLQFIPPLLESVDGITIYTYMEEEVKLSDTVYYLIFYMFMTTISISIPFLVPELKRTPKIVYMLFAGWFFSAVAFHVMGIIEPELMENIDTPSATYTRYNKCYFFNF